MIERIKSCLNELLEKLEDISDEKFEGMKESVKTKIRVKDLTLAGQMGRYWERIIQKKYNFDYKEKRVEIVDSISKQELQAKAKELFREREVQILVRN